MENPCIEPRSAVPFAINVGLHVTILFALLSALFLFYISQIEKQTLEHEIHNNIDDAADNFLSKMNPNEKSAMVLLLNNPVVDTLKTKYSVPPAEVTVHNTWLQRTIILVNCALIFTITLVTVILKYQCGQCIPIGHIIAENIATFTCVAVIEGLFFYFIALKFIPTVPSVIVNAFYDSVKNNL